MLWLARLAGHIKSFMLDRRRLDSHIRRHRSRLSFWSFQSCARVWVRQSSILIWDMCENWAQQEKTDHLWRVKARIGIQLFDCGRTIYILWALTLWTATYENLLSCLTFQRDWPHSPLRCHRVWHYLLRGFLWNSLPISQIWDCLCARVQLRSNVERRLPHWRRNHRRKWAWFRPFKCSSINHNDVQWKLYLCRWNGNSCKKTPLCCR